MNFLFGFFIGFLASYMIFKIIRVEKFYREFKKQLKDFPKTERDDV